MREALEEEWAEHWEVHWWEEQGGDFGLSPLCMGWLAWRSHPMI